MSRARDVLRALAVALASDVRLTALDVGLRLVAWTLGVRVVQATTEPRKGARIPIAPRVACSAADLDRLHYRRPAQRATACGVALFPLAHVAFTQEPDAVRVEWAEGRACATCADAARDELKRRAS